jgi:hypothetical protein
MKKLVVVTIAIILYQSTLAQSESYQRVRIWMDHHSVAELAATGIDLCESFCRNGLYYETDMSTDEWQRINTAGFRTEVIINDVVCYYQGRNEQSGQRIQAVPYVCGATPDYPQPANFNYGSMGGFLTYQELLSTLDDMATLYPNLITIKQPINSQTTIEGRPVYWVKISDNPNTDEPEPEVLYTALHHAREPNGMAALVYYMWYLLEHYATDADIQQLVDNTEMYFVPCVNPDGYVYNETTDPSGGGMWRKNRRDNGDGTYGVDLNRNYGYQWGFDDAGSSPDPSMATFRGTAAFSEPETQMINDFCQVHNFKIALNYHTYSNLLINPWGYLPNFYTPDSALFDQYTGILTTYNYYKRGTSNQTVGYMVNGSSDDWMYGEQTLKPKVMAMTPEVGSFDDGFWPQQTRIVDLCKENMYANIMAARLAGRYGKVYPNDTWNIASLNAYQGFDFTLLGLDTSGNYTISLTALSSNVVATGPAKVFSGLSLMQAVNDSISFTLATTVLPGDEVKFLITVNNGLYDVFDTITRYYGPVVVPFADDANNFNNWQSVGLWNTTVQSYVSAPSSITDSPNGPYNSNDFNEMTVIPSINLLNAAAARLSFYARWEIEPQFDYAQLLISDDNGASWTPLCGKFTKPGSMLQDPDNPVYDGFQTEWVKEDINLNAYTGKNIQLKWLMASDGFVEYDGIYVDDIRVEKIVASGVGYHNLQSGSFAVYPNPAHDHITIEIPLSENGTITLRNAFGQTIKKASFSSKTNQVKMNVSDLAAGMYFLELQFEQGYKTNGKIMISER